jgi:hypothetical protein
MTRRVHADRQRSAAEALQSSRRISVRRGAAFVAQQTTPGHGDENAEGSCVAGVHDAECVHRRDEVEVEQQRPGEQFEHGGNHAAASATAITATKKMSASAVRFRWPRRIDSKIVSTGASTTARGYPAILRLAGRLHQLRRSGSSAAARPAAEAPSGGWIGCLGRSPASPRSTPISGLPLTPLGQVVVPAGRRSYPPVHSASGRSRPAGGPVRGTYSGGRVAAS